jgi:hypothetical protein
MPSSGDLKISLYDSRGSLIQTIFKGIKEAGTHQFKIEQPGLSSGVYFIQAVFGNHRRTSKIILMK